jgi:hypothetical protein
MNPAKFFTLVNESSDVNTAKCSTEVVFYDWKTFLEQFFVGTVKGISQVHHLSFENTKPGMVKHRTWFTDEWSVTSLLKPGITPDMIRAPQGGLKKLSELVLARKDLTPERTKQLAGMGRQYCPLRPDCSDQEYSVRHPFFLPCAPPGPMGAAAEAAM